MAEKLEIEVVIGPDGNVTFETHGLKGNTCMTETESLEKALGTVKSRTKTSEFYQQSTTAKGTTRQR